MKIKLVLLLVVGSSLMVVQAAAAQERSVKIVRFEVDKKTVDQPFKISLSVRGKTFEPAVNKDGFVIPADLPETETVDIRFQSGNYNLSFESVPVSKFNLDWIFGIDTNPFEPENVESVEPDPPGKELSRIYYLNFRAKDGPETRMVVKEFN